MWSSLRFRNALLVMASLATVMVSLAYLVTVNDSTGVGLASPRLVVFTLLSLLGILVLALSFLSLRQFVRPLRALTETVEKIARGDYHAAEKTLGGVSEIEQLRQALNHLAQQVLAGQAATEFYIARITDAEEEERKRLARELHDDTIQAVVVLGQHVDNLREMGTVGPTTSALVEIRRQVSNLSDSLRRFASALRPPYLEDLGLVVALQQLAQESGAQIQTSGAEYALGEKRDIDLYRIVQEALRNAVQHAHAQHIELRISFLNHELLIQINDDGLGFAVPADRTAFARANHFGLMGMQERAHLMGGTFQIRSEPGRGTTIQIRIPILNQES